MEISTRGRPRVLVAFLALACAVAVVFCVAPVEEAHAAPTGSREGTAYAVLTDANDSVNGAGKLILFRSTNTYSAGSNQTVTDVMGNGYTGRVYTGIETNNTDTVYNSPWHAQNASILSVDIADGQVIAPINTVHWFDGCANLGTCDLNGLDTSSVTSMNCMFSYCNGASFTTPDVSDWDTSSVTNMAGMFYGCSGASFTAPDVSDWDTSSVTNMAGMFYGCSGAAFTAPDVSSWDTSKVTTMSRMFADCSGAGFTEIDLSGWDVSSVTSMYSMFSGCRNLETIYASQSADWNASSVLTDSWGMFSGCSKLKGGNDTVYDSSVVDKAYARVDGLGGAPGYFTTASGMGMPSSEFSDEINAVKASLVAVSTDGWDVEPANKWTVQTARDGIDAAIATAEASLADSSITDYTSNSKILAAAVEIYENAKHDGLASRENLATTVASAKANLVAVSVDGLDVDATAKWTNQSARTAMDTAISTAQAVVDDNSATQFAEPTRALRTAMVTYNTAKQDGLATAATLSTLIEQAQSSLVPVSADGSDIDASSKWTTQAARDAMDSAIVAAQAIVDDPSSTAFVAAMNDLQTAMDTYGAAKQAGTVDATDLSALIAQARDARIDNVSADGSDVWSDQQWVTQAQQDAYDAAIAAAQAYTAGTASTGTAIQHVVTSSGGHGSAGAPPSGSSGAPSGGSPSSGGTPPDKPSGSSSSSKSAS